jgi:prepilin-type N-terminal cleavage/methylation domain-containing protein
MMKGFMKMNLKGYTLIELLATLVVFSLVMLGVYSFFDQSQWLHMSASKRTNIQEQTRLIMELMERDLRMIGFGVPKTSLIGGTLGWHPFIFNASATHIYYRADSDNANVIAKQDLANGGNQLFVHSIPATFPCPGPLVLVDTGRRWQSTSCSSIVGADRIDISPPAAQTFESNITEAFSIEQIYYRFISDANYPFGRIERAVVPTNTPVITVPANDQFVPVGYNIADMKLDLYRPDGSLITSNPFTTGDLQVANKISLVIVGRDRSSVQGQYQDVTLRSEILIRNRKF